MSEMIIRLIQDIDKYQEMSAALSVISRKFSYKNEQNLLIQSIFLWESDILQYQIRSKSQIHSIDKESIDLLDAIEHFAKYGYEYLYIMENGVIVDSISYHEFIKYGLINKTRNYVIEKKQVEKIGIDKYITIHNEFNRIVVVDDDEFQYEINLMTEPELLHSIERELIALRIMPLFAQEVKQQLQQYSVITVFADDYVSDFCRKICWG